MNKFLSKLKNSYSFKRVDMNFKKKVLFFDKEFEKFSIKEVYLKDYLKEGKTLVLSPYPCKFINLFFENSGKKTKFRII